MHLRTVQHPAQPRPPTSALAFDLDALGVAEELKGEGAQGAVC